MNLKTILLLIALSDLIYLSSAATGKYRVVILTDQTHDDGNSLIRYLYYSHLFDTEAIIVTPQLPDFKHNDEGPWQKAMGIIDAYAKEYPHLKKHHAGLIEPEALGSITKKGRGALPIIWLTNTRKFTGEIAGRYVESQWNDIRFHDWIGEGLNPNGEPRDSEGSEYLQEVFARNDDRPIFVQAWGGPITFVQALYRYRQRQGEEKFRKLLGKIFLYGIHLQDITFDYFINLNDVSKTSCLNMGDTRSTYTGKRVQPARFVYDQGHFWKYITVMKQKEVNGHGPMSALYDHGGEGDTPAFLFLISAALGLNDPLDPTQGSWGSMFKPMGEPFPANYYSACKVDANEIQRWIPDAKNSFLNRLQWSVKMPGEVNREPFAVIGKDKSNQIIRMKGKPGKTITLDASRSYDPDGDALNYNWFVYEDASDYRGFVKTTGSTEKKVIVSLPEDFSEIHLVLEVRDHGTPSLVSYRRVIVINNKHPERRLPI